MKKVILSFLIISGASLIGGGISQANAKQCWFDYEGGCDSGGWQACGVCDDDPIIM